MFPTEQAWMINPHRKGRRAMATRTRKRRGRKGRMPAGLARYWAAKRAGRSGARKRKRSHTRKRTRRNQPFVMANPKRRRRSHAPSVHRRRYQRNPGLGGMIPSMGFLKEVAFVAGGYYGTKISAGFVLPMVGIGGDLPRIVIKSVLALAVSYVGGMLLGARVKESLLMGGALEVAQDAVKTYLSPFVPALAAAEMESYYLPASTVQGDNQTQHGTGAYYQTGELPSDNYAM